MITEDKTAIILVNLGTPDEPTAPAIRRFLREFLSDPRVVDLPRWLWLPILHLFVLTFRPKKLVHNYELIWGHHDGPIRNITDALARRLEFLLERRGYRNSLIVRTAMTYGNPSIKETLLAVRAEGATSVLVIPLYPQYAGATTGSVYDALGHALQEVQVPELRFVPEYHDHPAYIHALTKSLDPYHDYLEAGAKLVFSFHGIPVAQVSSENPYPGQCQRTAELVAHNLGLDDAAWQVTYQSRFGPAEWLTPYTSDVMAALPREGHDKVLVVCPGFATDCLETTEEIKIQNRDIFIEHGGQEFRYARALNARKIHAEAMVALVEERLFPAERNGFGSD